MKWYIRELEGMRKGLEALQLSTSLNCHPIVTSLVFPTVKEAVIDADVWVNEHYCLLNFHIL